MIIVIVKWGWGWGVWIHLALIGNIHFVQYHLRCWCLQPVLFIEYAHVGIDCHVTIKQWVALYKLEPLRYGIEHPTSKWSIIWRYPQNTTPFTGKPCLHRNLKLETEYRYFRYFYINIGKQYLTRVLQIHMTKYYKPLY